MSPPPLEAFQRRGVLSPECHGSLEQMTFEVPAGSAPCALTACLAPGPGTTEDRDTGHTQPVVASKCVVKASALPKA